MSHQSPADEKVADPQVHFPGELFAQAREEKGLSLTAVAAELHLSKLYLHAIETSDFDRIRNPVFARGYIRTYARFLKLDGEAMVAAYDDSQGHHAGSAQVKSVDSIHSEARLGGSLLKVSAWVAAVAVVGITFWWWKAQNTAEPVQTSSAIQNETVVVETLSGDELEVAPQTVLSPLELTSEQPASVAQPVVEPVPADIAPVAEPVTGAAQKLAPDSEPESAVEPVVAVKSLEVSFSADCWLEVRNLQGRILFSGVKNQGETLRLNTAQGYSLKIGNMSGVEQLRFAGDSVELAPYAGRRVARIELPGA